MCNRQARPGVRGARRVVTRPRGARRLPPRRRDGPGGQGLRHRAGRALWRRAARVRRGARGQDRRAGLARGHGLHRAVADVRVVRSGRRQRGLFTSDGGGAKTRPRRAGHGARAAASARDTASAFVARGPPASHRLLFASRGRRQRPRCQNYQTRSSSLRDWSPGRPRARRRARGGPRGAEPPRRDCLPRHPHQGRAPRGGEPLGALRRRGRAGLVLSPRGACEDESWRRRGCDVDIPWRRVAATPVDVDVPWRRVAATPVTTWKFGRDAGRPARASGMRATATTRSRPTARARRA